MAGVREQGVEQARREFAVGGEIAFDHRDGSGEDYAIAGQDAVYVALEREAAWGSGVHQGHGADPPSRSWLG